MLNSIDIYKGIFLYVIPVRVIVLCLKIGCIGLKQWARNANEDVRSRRKIKAGI